MKTFITIFRSSVIMISRSRVYLLTSLGLSLISIFIFGWLFGNAGTLKLNIGIVDQDHSTFSQSLIAQLKHSSSLAVHTGSQSSQLDDMKSGRLDAVLLVPTGFGSAIQQTIATSQQALVTTQGNTANAVQAQPAQLDVYYDRSNITTLSITRGAVQDIVAQLNTSITGKAPFITISEQAVSVHALQTIDFIVPGMIGMMLMWANLAVGEILVTWRQQGITKRLGATPMSSATLISAQMLARLFVSLAQAAILIVVGMEVFHVQVNGSWWLLFLTVAVSSLAMLAIGFIIGSIAKNSDVAQAINMLISFPMMFLSGSYFSTASAPDALKPVINALPLTHVNDALRQVMNNGASFSAIQGDILIIAAWAIVGIVLSVRAFRWT